MDSGYYFTHAKELLEKLRDCTDKGKGDTLIIQIIHDFMEMQTLACEEAHEYGLIEGADSVR